MERRTVLKGGLAALALAGTAGSTSLLQKALAGKFSLPLMMQPVIAANAAPSPIGGGFTTALAIPPLLEDLDNTPGSARFSMNVQQGKMDFFPGKPTTTMGYNGNFLGPTIRVRNGQRFRINVNNNLPQTTTLHWHGLHIPAQWDGGPRQPVPAGTTWKPDFTIKQEAATLWYHPPATCLPNSHFL